MTKPIKTGLVLSGGGAKGAYQVGILKALLEQGFCIDEISGASIGALNGAILASAPDLKIGLLRLEEIWLTLANNSPISLNSSGYLRLLVAAGLKVQGSTVIEKILGRALSLSGETGFLCDAPLQSLIDSYLDLDLLSKGPPLYISVFESGGGVIDLLKIASAELGLVDTENSKFLHIQSLPATQQKELLLASAAIPLLFAPRQVNGSPYSDGGQGGWQKMQGNTPIAPLLQSGCNLIIVSHLINGSSWSRHDFPEATILEIRPQSSINRSSGLMAGTKDLLGFDSQKIPSWIEQGYQDTLHCIERVAKASASRNALRHSREALAASEQYNVQADSTLENAMSRLR